MSKRVSLFSNFLTLMLVVAMVIGCSGNAQDEDKKAEEVRPDPVVRIDPALEKLAKTQESLQVIIIFGAQPQRDRQPPGRELSTLKSTLSEKGSLVKENSRGCILFICEPRFFSEYADY